MPKPAVWACRKLPMPQRPSVDARVKTPNGNAASVVPSSTDHIARHSSTIAFEPGGGGGREEGEGERVEKGSQSSQLTMSPDHSGQNRRGLFFLFSFYGRTEE